jgi:aspartate-semialdehyde dehydrogenase
MSFTGSTAIGKVVAQKCAATMKRVIMELGGHAPFIIFDDVNVDRAVTMALAAKFTTSGQDCLGANRIYVHREIYDRFCAAFAKRVTACRVGNGLDGDTEIGPLIHLRAIDKMQEHVTDALSHGARVLVGGRTRPAGSMFFEPTVLADVPDTALIMREETFGPVAAVTPFNDETEVVARANATEYGLVAYLFTENGARQLRMARTLEYGMVAINRVAITGAPVPFGGVKQSGLGREGSRHGIEAFTELKYVCLSAA